MKRQGDVQKLVEIKVARSVQVDVQHGLLQAAIKFQLVVLRTLRQSSCQLLEIKGAFDRHMKNSHSSGHFYRATFSPLCRHANRHIAQQEVPMVWFLGEVLEFTSAPNTFPVRHWIRVLDQGVGLGVYLTHPCQCS